MNRAQRRRLERQTKSALRIRPNRPGVEQTGVRLHGGPMDGWYVQPDAPALRPDWHTTWPKAVARKNRPGRYELGEKRGVEQTATWQELQT